MPALVAFDTLPQLFQRVARHFDGQQRAALSYKDKQTKAWVDVSWEEFARRVRAFAGYLHSRGVRSGDRVAILSENRPEWAIADLAALHLGAVGVALYPTLPADQVQYILQNSGAKWLVASTGLQVKKAEAVFDACEALEGVVTMAPTREPRGWAVDWEVALGAGAGYADEHRDLLDRLWHAVEPDDLAALIYTSGTTGLPKGVMLTHRNFASNTRAALERIVVREDDVHLSFLPLSHAFERVAGYFVMMAAGARIAYAESIDAVAKNLPEV